MKFSEPDIDDALVVGDIMGKIVEVKHGTWEH